MKILAMLFLEIAVSLSIIGCAGKTYEMDVHSAFAALLGNPERKRHLEIINNTSFETRISMNGKAFIIKDMNRKSFSASLRLITQRGNDSRSIPIVITALGDESINGVLTEWIIRKEPRSPTYETWLIEHSKNQLVLTKIN